MTVIIIINAKDYRILYNLLRFFKKYKLFIAIIHHPIML